MFCDLVQCYKIVYKQVDLPVDNLFSFDINSHNIRGHSFRLKRAGRLSEFCCSTKDVHACVCRLQSSMLRY